MALFAQLNKEAKLKHYLLITAKIQKHKYDKIANILAKATS